MNESHIIAVTGPRLVGKTAFLSSLEKIMTDQGISSSKLARATSRSQRESEMDGFEYKFLSDDVMEEGIKKGEIVGDYSFRNHKYGILKSSLDTDSEVKLVVIGNPAGLVNLKDVTGYDITPVFLYSDSQDIEQRIIQILRESDDSDVGNNVTARLKDFDRDLPIFMELIDRSKYVIYNPNISSVSSETMTSSAFPELLREYRVSHLAYRLLNAMKLENDEAYDGLKPNQLRAKYVDSLVNILFGISTDELLNNTDKAAFKFDEKIIDEYSSRATGKSKSEVKKAIPNFIGVASGYGVLSIYVNLDSDNKEIVSDIIEMHLGLPQYRFDEKSPDLHSPMSLATVPKCYTNFYLSFSAAYDPPALSKRDSPIHTLTIEGIGSNNGPPKVIHTLEPDDAQLSWNRRKEIIKNTRIPYMLH